MGRTEPEGHGPSAELAAVALVLGDDDMLVEVLLRLDFPTCLVRAALVCRRWLRRASDPAFLRRFRALHPPRVLGLQVEGRGSPARFLPVPQPQELAAAARRALETLGRAMPAWDCRNGRALVDTYGPCTIVVRSLLRAAPDIPLPRDPCFTSFSSGLEGNWMFFLEDDDDSTSCLFLTMTIDGRNVDAEFSILQSGVWGVKQSAEAVLQTAHAERLAYQIMRGEKLIVGRKVYMLAARRIIGLDLVTASFFTVKPPDGAGNHSLSRAQLSGLYLIDATGLQLRVWHGNGLGQWVLKGTISVREACGHLNVQRWEPDAGNAPVCVVDAGDNAEFVILKLVASGIVCCMQLGNRNVEKVDGTIPEFFETVPVTMVWPPTFPVIDKEQ